MWSPVADPSLGESVFWELAQGGCNLGRHKKVSARGDGRGYIPLALTLPARASTGSL